MRIAIFVGIFLVTLVSSCTAEQPRVFIFEGVLDNVSAGHDTPTMDVVGKDGERRTFKVMPSIHMLTRDELAAYETLHKAHPNARLAPSPDDLHARVRVFCGGHHPTILLLYEVIGRGAGKP